MPGIADIASKLKTQKPVSDSPKSGKKSADKKSSAPPKKQSKKSGGKRGARMAELRPKILAMEKSGKSLSEIASELELSNSYVWVIARNYKYDPDTATPKKKKSAAKSKDK
jgi:DNA invertase Pin-like site-specific DNA recombinase